MRFPVRFILILAFFLAVTARGEPSSEERGVPQEVLEYIEKRKSASYRVRDVSESYYDLLEAGHRVYLLRLQSEGIWTRSYLLFDGRSVAVLNGVENLSNSGRFLRPRYSDFNFAEEEASALASDIVKLVLVDSDYAGVALDDIQLIRTKNFLEKHPNVPEASVLQFRNNYRKPSVKASEGGGQLQFLIFTVKGAVVNCEADLGDGGDFIQKLRFRMIMPEGSLVYPYR